MAKKISYTVIIVLLCLSAYACQHTDRFVRDIAAARDFDMLITDLKSADMKVRMSAIEALSGIDDSRAVDILAGIVEDRKKDWRVRARAIRSLAGLGDDRVVALLIKALNDPVFTRDCPALKWNAAIALGSFGNDPEIVDALILALSDRTLYIREAAIQSLGEIGSRNAVPYLISALSDKSFAVRMSAINALGKIGDKSAAPFIKRLLDDVDPHIRDAAAKALSIMDYGLY